MLRYINYDIVFQEIPGEVTLAINLSNCPNKCKGCHSPYLTEDRGDVLDENSLDCLLKKYGNAITCVCFMGGDASPQDIDNLAAFLHKTTNQRIKTGWYSGKSNFSSKCSIANFNYIKLGPYIESIGGLSSPQTNQRFYRIDNGEMVDMTYCFRKKTS